MPPNNTAFQKHSRYKPSNDLARGYLSLNSLSPIPNFKLIRATESIQQMIDLIQNLIDKVESYHNFSYQSINKKKDVSADTTVALNKEVFLKAPNDKLFGYFYSIETNYTTETFHKTDLYNGEGLTILSVTDSTFFAENAHYSAYGQSLIGSLTFIKERYDKKLFKVIMLNDTIIDGVIN